MRDIEGVEESLAILAPHCRELEDNFNRENERFLRLVGLPHDQLGRVLKCHLIVERYLEEHLEAECGLSEIVNAKLTFFQKAALLPNGGKSSSFVKLAILELNSIRNRFGHKVGFSLEDASIPQITEVLRISRPNFTGSAVEAIEAFTAIACTFLLVPSPDMKALFEKAFSQIRVTSYNLDL